MLDTIPHGPVDLQSAESSSLVVRIVFALYSRFLPRRGMRTRGDGRYLMTAYLDGCWRPNRILRCLDDRFRRSGLGVALVETVDVTYLPVHRLAMKFGWALGSVPYMLLVFDADDRGAALLRIKKIEIVG